MRKIRCFVFAIICMVICPLVSNAECSYERQAELSRLASNVQLSYSYTVDSSQTPIFTIYITNLTNDIYLRQDNYEVIYGIGEKSVDVSYGGGQNNYYIYSNDPSCKDDLLVTKSITLPETNMYADSSECKNYPTFKYCSRWGIYSIDSSDFYSAFTQYKNDLKAEKKEMTSENTVLSEILEVIINNRIMIMFLGIMVLITIICYFLQKGRKK